ncbi:MAG TPA: heparan-alpha-glucosaminide N-acetyltransferase domain-containing protein [Pyrinomonadaceae bacterium]|nr:heparan-alpha-glucosaminide N-acetyltransferase domain-containing protein [Pyrinomonadaceae bacterium]
MEPVTTSNLNSVATTLPPDTSTEMADPLGGMGAAMASDNARATTKRRLDSVDLLRGLVMVIMMLDHTREFFHSASLDFDPLDLTKTSAILFFTRWITHFCAPVFVFLAGTGAYLQFSRGKSKRELSKFLVTRGLWLVFLELTVLHVLIWFNVDWHFVGLLQVIWAIGISMICLAALIHLPVRVIAAFGVAMIALHNLLDKIHITQWRGPGTATPSFWESIWMVLHQPGLIFFGDRVYALALYPLIPWIGVMAAGYAFGALYKLDAERRRKILLRLGGALTLAFVVIRATNFYGDQQKWETQGNLLFTVLSFLDVTKYPPSLLFLLMTLGPAIIALALFEKMGRGPISRALITFGRVPLFFYLLQWTVAHGLAVIAGYLAGQPTAWQFATLFDKPRSNPGNLGFSLPVVYVFWITGVLLIYPLCRWFAGVKQRRKDWWLSYL